MTRRRKGTAKKHSAVRPGRRSLMQLAGTAVPPQSALELDRGGRFRLFRILGFDRPENLALSAQHTTRQRPLHPAGEFAGCVLAGAAAGRHAPKIGMRAGESNRLTGHQPYGAQRRFHVPRNWPSRQQAGQQAATHAALAALDRVTPWQITVVRQRCRGPPAGRDRETASGHGTPNSHDAMAECGHDSSDDPDGNPHRLSDLALCLL
jgi:hypothetical protein